MSDPTSPYYIKGAEGMAVVASIASKHFADLAADYIANGKPKGVNLVAGFTFRPYELQVQLYKNRSSPSAAAPPGKSNHEAGIAIDFLNIGGGVKEGATCENRSARPEIKEWEYLNSTAQKFGVHQLPIEAWHWDLSPASCNTPWVSGT